MGANSVSFLYDERPGGEFRSTSGLVPSPEQIGKRDSFRVGLAGKRSICREWAGPRSPLFALPERAHADSLHWEQMRVRFGGPSSRDTA